MDRKHNLTRVDGRWACSVCRWEWQSKPHTRCPGLPRYTWASRPDHMQTKTALDREGFKLAGGQQPVGCVLAGDNSRYFMLYDRGACEAKRTPTPAQLEALAKAQEASLAARTCIDCGTVFRPEDARYYLDDEGRCSNCAQQRQVDEESSTARAMLRQLATAGDWLILDTETTGLEEDAEIVQIAIVDATGDVVFESLIRPAESIPIDAIRVHGITDAVVANAPRFADVYQDLVQAIAGRHVLAYNAPFDQRILRQTCDRYGLPEPDVRRWTCIMDLYARHWGDWSSWHNNFRYQSLAVACRREGISADTPLHNAVGDALLTCRLVQQLGDSLTQYGVEDERVMQP